MIKVPIGEHVVGWDVSKEAEQVAMDTLEYEIMDGGVGVTKNSIVKALQLALEIDFGEGNRIWVRQRTVNVEGPPSVVFDGKSFTNY